MNGAGGSRRIWSVGFAVVMTLVAMLVGPGAACAAGPTLVVSVGHPVTAADRSTTTWLKVALTGQAPDGQRGRTPVNVAFVIDRSGSMSGEKIRQARSAALAALDHLGPKDIVSVVIYDHVVNVLVPATKLTDRGAVERAIRGLETRGDTALFAGVARGAAEVRKFAGPGYVNRVVLLSDGLANVGPSTPGALGDLGASLGREGVGVTTIGLGAGYNEDLMTVLARRSDGTHYFAERASDLSTVFRYELGDLTSVAAQDLRVRVECADGVRPLRALGLDAWISGRVVTATMNQLYAGQERFVLIEVEVPARGADGSFDVARAEDGQVLADATLLLATERAHQAVLLRDEGRVEEARRLLIDNVRELEDGATRWKAPKLKAYKDKNQADADGVDDSANWNVQRKTMRRDENYYELQQMH